MLITLIWNYFMISNYQIVHSKYVQSSIVNYISIKLRKNKRRSHSNGHRWDCQCIQNRANSLRNGSSNNSQYLLDVYQVLISSLNIYMHYHPLKNSMRQMLLLQMFDKSECRGLEKLSGFKFSWFIGGRARITIQVNPFPESEHVNHYATLPQTVICAPSSPENRS